MRLFCDMQLMKQWLYFIQKIINSFQYAFSQLVYQKSCVLLHMHCIPCLSGSFATAIFSKRLTFKFYYAFFIFLSPVIAHTDNHPVGQHLQYDTARLHKDATKQQELKTEFLNKFLFLLTTNEKWQSNKESFILTYKEDLGPNKQHHKEWISAETLKKTRREGEKRQKSTTWAGKARAYEEYPHVSKIAKKSIKADKRELYMYEHAGNKNRRGSSPRKTMGAVHHHPETVWKV